MRATLPSVCPHDCPSQCALQVTVEAGRITDVTGDARHPFTRGVICGKVQDYAERVYGATRVSRPLRRVGPKGEGRFEPIGWDEAVDEIAHRWRRVIAQWGAEAILPFSYGGTLGLVLLHPADGAARGVRSGDPVLVRSARGEARFTAELTDDTREGVAVVEGIWWSKHQPGGRGVNALTDDRTADMGGGPALHSNLVQVERL